MIISHTKKFIFIHNYKVAGTSIRKVLNEYSYHKNISNRLKSYLGIYPKIYSDDFSGHIKTYDLKKQLPENIFYDYFKFGFVRNPWDWQVSLYEYALKNKNHYQHKLISEFKNFEEYIYWRIEKDKHYQKDFFYSPDGTLLVNFIGRYENLQEDFKFVCNKLGIQKSFLPHLNKSSNKNYRLYYSTALEKVIEKAFYDDIKLFNYKF